MITRLLIYCGITLGIIATCWYAATNNTAARTQPHSVLTRIVPITLEDTLVFPTNHSVIPLDPAQDYRWQSITLPPTWPIQQYYIELWDANNKPVPGFAAQRLDNHTIDISTIDASLTPALRVVIFQPPGSSDPPPDYAVYINYEEFPNRRLFVLFGLAAWLGVTLLMWTLLQRTELKKYPSALAQLLHGQFISPYFATLSTVLFAGMFGAVLGSFIGGRQIVYVLIKLPFLMGGALIISFSTLLLLSWLTGVKATLKEIWRVALNLLAITAIGLCSLTPILGFYIIYPLNHDQVLVATISFFLGAGLLALLSLYRWQHKLILPVVWLVIYGIVFMQLGWLLRPWVGVIDPVHNTVPIARANSGNVFIELIHAVERTNSP